MKILGYNIQKDLQSKKMTEKSVQTSTIIRDLNGNIIGSDNSMKLNNADLYLSAFRSVFQSKNFVTLFHSMAELQFPVMSIIDRVLKAKLVLKDYDTDSVIYDDPAINKFLSRPNEMQDYTEFMTDLIAYLLVTGNSYMYAATPGLLSSWDRLKSTDNYYILPAADIIPEYNNNAKLYSGASQEELITKYWLNLFGRREFETNNVLHFKMPNLISDRDILLGRSPLQAAEFPLSNLCAVYEARNVIYVKRGALGAIVSNKKDDAGTSALTPAEKKSLQDQQRENYGLERDKSQYWITDVPVSFVRFNMSIDELKPFDETLADSIAIAGVYRMPPDLLPRKDKSTFANQKNSEVSFYSNAVIPLASRIENQFNYFFGFKKEKGGRYLAFDFSGIEVLQIDKGEEAKTLDQKTKTAILKFEKGLITYNMMLVQSGEEKVEGGDYYVWDQKNKLNNNSI